MDTNNGQSLHAYTDKQRGVRPGRTVLCCLLSAAESDWTVLLLPGSGTEVTPK